MVPQTQMSLQQRWIPSVPFPHIPEVLAWHGQSCPAWRNHPAETQQPKKKPSPQLQEGTGALEWPPVLGQPGLQWGLGLHFWLRCDPAIPCAPEKRDQSLWALLSPPFSSRSRLPLNTGGLSCGDFSPSDLQRNPAIKQLVVEAPLKKNKKKKIKNPTKKKLIKKNHFERIRGKETPQLCCVNFSGTQSSDKMSQKYPWRGAHDVSDTQRKAPTQNPRRENRPGEIPTGRNNPRLPKKKLGRGQRGGDTQIPELQGHL